MKKLFTLFLLLSSVSTEFAGPVTMPSSQVLATRLYDTLSSQYFNEKTKLTDKLGGQQIEAFDVVIQVDRAIYDFSKYLKDPLIGLIMLQQRPEIIKTLLQDYPEAIEELKSNGLLKKLFS